MVLMCRLRTYSSRDVNSLLVFARNHFSISTKDTIEIHLFEESGVHCESNCDCRGTSLTTRLGYYSRLQELFVAAYSCM